MLIIYLKTQLIKHLNENKNQNVIVKKVLVHTVEKTKSIRYAKYRRSLDRACQAALLGLLIF